MRALVTGAGGFLGGAIARLLRERDFEVRGLQRSASPDLDAIGVHCFRGDICQGDALDQAVRGCDIVFHVAARVGTWGDYREFHRVNVEGTGRIVELCGIHRVPRLVFTSSPSVVFTGHDDAGLDRTAPYPDRYLSPYPQTKALAEQLVLAANSPELTTIALRPHLIWGPGDSHLVPRILERARAGRLRLVGDGSNLVDSTYIDNAAHAHLRAADCLSPYARCAGKAYFVSNGQPLPIAELMGKILQAAGLPTQVPSIPAGAAYCLGAVLERLHRAFGRSGEPLVTRFVARELASAHWFDLTATQEDLGYKPLVSVDEGMRMLKASLQVKAAA